MPDTESNPRIKESSSSDKTPPPGSRDRSTGIVIVVLLTLGALLLWFIFSQIDGPQPAPPRMEVDLPAIERPQPAAPEVELEVPEEIDIDVAPEASEQIPEAGSQQPEPGGPESDR